MSFYCYKPLIQFNVSLIIIFVDVYRMNHVNILAVYNRAIVLLSRSARHAKTSTDRSLLTYLVLPIPQCRHAIFTVMLPALFYLSLCISNVFKFLHVFHIFHIYVFCLTFFIYETDLFRHSCSLRLAANFSAECK